MSENKLMYNEIMSPIAEYLKKIATEIEILLAPLANENAGEMVEYFMSRRGHMLRPSLTLLSAGAVDGEVFNDARHECLYAFGACIEMLHSASLIHDDVIDVSDERRGDKALQVVYSNSKAVLGGDILYLRSFQRIIGIENAFYLHHCLDVAELMCRGEIRQMFAIGKTLTKEQYLDIILTKTSVVTELACWAGARIAGADETVQQSFTTLGRAVGVLYQLRDDVADHDLPDIAGFDVRDEMFMWKTVAMEALHGLHDSVYKQALLKLLDFLTI